MGKHSVKSMTALLEGIDLAGKWAVVVGGTSGVGEGIATRLGMHKMAVIVVGRNEQRGQEVVAEVKKQGGDEASTFIRCDAMILGNIRACAASIEKVLPNGTLDFLVTTQGIATSAGYTPTKEGIEQKLAIHYLSRQAFAETLAPMLVKSSDPRVLNVLSAGVHKAWKDYKTNTELKKNFSIANAATTAGFYNDLAADFMSKKYSPIKFIHASPGLVSTNWGNEFGPVLKAIVRVLQQVPGLTKSKEDCGVFMCSGLLRPAEELFKDGKGYALMGDCGEEVKATDGHNDEAKAFIQEWTYKKFDEFLK